MSYYADLTPYEYDKQNEGGKAVNVGWLSVSHEFTRGPTPASLARALRALPVGNQYRGWHGCEFCREHVGRKLDMECCGNGDVRVFDADGTVFVAPRLIAHYVEAHQYQPPQAFIDAVLAGFGREIA